MSNEVKNMHALLKIDLYELKKDIAEKIEKINEYCGYFKKNPCLSNAVELQQLLEKYLELITEKRTLDYARHVVYKSVDMGDLNTVGVYKHDLLGMWVFQIGHHTMDLQGEFETAGEALEHGVKLLKLHVDSSSIEEEFGHEIATVNLA